MADFIPFASVPQETLVRGRGDSALTISSDEQSIAIHGDLEIIPDSHGLDAARRLRDILTATISRLEAGDLPTSPDDGSDPVVRRKNPFG